MKDASATIELTHIPCNDLPWQRKKIFVKHGIANEKPYIPIEVPKQGFNAATIYESEGNEVVPSHSLNVHVDITGKIEIFINWK